MQSKIFKPEDNVYNWKYGWGTVTSYLNRGYYCRFKSEYARHQWVSENELSFTEYNFKTGGFSHERPLRLEYGKSYVRVQDYVDLMVIERKGVNGNYGFHDGKWVEGISCGDIKNWQEATDKQVGEALKQEAIRRFGEGWRNVKVKECVYHEQSSRLTNAKRHVSHIIKNTSWQVWGVNGCLFYKGRWAELLEEDFRPDFEVGELILVRDFDHSIWEAVFFECYIKDNVVSIGGIAWNQYMKFDKSYHRTPRTPGEN